MVVKFKISKNGRRFLPNLKPDSPEPQLQTHVEELHKQVDAGTSSRQLFQPPVNRKRSADATENAAIAAENLGSELSFILNIFPDGYSIVDPPESKILQQNPVKYFRKFLRPYNRSSESLITTVECGLLPVNFLGGIQCKYVEGKVLCEVRDYRRDSSDIGIYDSARAPFPTIKKLSLQMTLDDVVKDLHLISDSSWEYGDILEAESRILNAIQPKLYLDPTPNFDRLCRRPSSTKLNLDIRGMRLKRLRQSSAPQRSAREQPDFVSTISTSPHNHVPNASVAASSPGSCQSSYQDGQMSFMIISDKGTRLNPIAIDGNQSLDHSINASECLPKRSVMGQPDFMNTISASPSIVAFPSVSCQSSYQIGVENPCLVQDSQMSSLVISDKRSQLNPIALDGNQSFDYLIKAHESLPERSVMGQPNFMNQISTSPSNYQVPDASIVASSSVSCQSSYQIGVEYPQHVHDGQMSTMFISDKRSRSNPIALDGSQLPLDGSQLLDNSINACVSVPEISVMGQLEFVNTTSTGLINHAPNVSNAASTSISCQPRYQIGVENPGHMQDGLLTSMVVSDKRSRLNLMAHDANQSPNHSINARESEPKRSVMGQLDFVTTESTGLIYPASNASNAASSSVSGQSSYQIGVKNPGHMQDGQMSSRVISDEGSGLNSIADGYQSLNHSINARESVPRSSVMGQPDFVNTLSTRPRVHAQNVSIAASSSVSGQSSSEIGVRNAGHMQDGQMSSMVIISDKGSRLNPIALDGYQSLNHSTNTHESLPVQQQSTVQQMINGTFNSYNLKQESVETGRINGLPQQFSRANFNHAPWNNMNPKLENNSIDGGTRSLISNVNGSSQQAQMTANWRSNSLVRSGSGSSAASSSTGNRVGRPPSNSIDLHLRDRFAKIQLLTSRFKLNFKTSKTDNIKPNITLPSKQFMHVLFYEHFNDHNYETPKDENETCEFPLSMSRVGGNVNICKTRIITFVKNERMLPGNEFLLTPKDKSRLILSERQSDGTVAMHYGELDDCDYLAEDILLPTFPNTHSADLFASEFCSLMILDGYRIESDHINPKPISTVQSTNSQPHEVFTHTLIQQFLASISDHLPIGLIGEYDSIPNPTMQPQDRELLSSSASRSQLNTMGQNSLGGPRRTPHGQSPMGTNPGSPIINRRKHGTLLPGHTANVMPTRNRMAERGMIMQCGYGTPSSNIGTLQDSNREVNPGSGSRGISIPGSGINRANDTNPVQRNVMPPPRFKPGINQNQNPYMNQQQLHLIKQESTSTSELEAARFPVQQVGSPSPSFGMIQQQMSQVSRQISSGVNHPSMSAGNQDGESSKTLSSMYFTRNM